MEQDKSPDAFTRAMEERRLDPSKRARSFPEDFASRPLGLIMLAIAALMFYLYTWPSISDARAGMDVVDHNGKGVFLQPFLVLQGIVYTVFGEHASKVLGPTTRPSLAGWAFLGVCGVVSWFYLDFIRDFLRGLGYVI